MMNRVSVDDSLLQIPVSSSRHYKIKCFSNVISALLLQFVLLQFASAQQIGFLAIGKKGAQAYRAELLQQLEDERASLRGLRARSKKTFNAERRKLLAKIDESEESIRQLQKKGSKFPGWKLPIVDMPPDRVGAVGLAGRAEMHWKVVQVIGNTEMLVRFGEQMLLVKGLSTENFVDDEVVKIPSGLPVSVGKSTYTTAIGGTNTVYLIQVILDELKEFLQKGEVEKIPDLEPFSFREWTSSSGKFKVEASLSKFEKGVVTLQKLDGKEIPVKLTELCEDDKKFVRDWTNP